MPFLPPMFQDSSETLYEFNGWEVTKGRSRCRNRNTCLNSLVPHYTTINTVLSYGLLTRVSCGCICRASQPQVRSMRRKTAWYPVHPRYLYLRGQMALQRLSGSGRMEEGYMRIFSVLKVTSQQNFFFMELVTSVHMHGKKKKWTDVLFDRV